MRLPQHDTNVRNGTPERVRRAAILDRTRRARIVDSRGIACRPLAALPLSLLLFAIAASPASAQTATPAQNALASPEAIKQREQELEAARAQQKAIADSQARLKAEIAA